ncbi:MAG: stage III sporulation protein AB [Clostridia bacterium]
MYSLIFGGALCVCSTYIGFAIKKNLACKKMFFVEWLNFVQFLSQNINFLKKPICEIIDSFVGGENLGKKSSFKNLLLAYKNLIENCQITNSNLDEIIKKYCPIANNQQKNVKDFFATLGTIDKESQLNNLNLLIEYIKKNIGICEKNCVSTGALSCKLGFVIGLAIMIIIG